MVEVYSRNWSRVYGIAMWASENHQECLSRTAPQSPAAAPVSTHMTTRMPVGHDNLPGSAHSPQGQGHRPRSALESTPATAAASFPCLFSGGLSHPHVYGRTFICRRPS